MSQKVIAFLGPEGTYSSRARIMYDPKAKGLPCLSNIAVIEAVQTGKADEGVVAIENALEGSVNDTTDFLIHNGEGVFICGEVIVPIRHFLFTRPVLGWELIKIVFSHPQALGQCGNFLRKHLPHAQQVASLSTVQAIEDMLESKTPAAAIAPYEAIEAYRGRAVVYGGLSIQDYDNNATRFAVIGREARKPTGNDKTSICFSFAVTDKPALLLRTLGVFARRGINLTKVESRPEKTELGRYVFLLDFEGHQEDKPVLSALRGLGRLRETDETGKSIPLLSMLRVFGSYPRQNGS